jgi:hypothetical protein
MDKVRILIVGVVLIVTASLALRATTLSPSSVMVGACLEAPATVKLDEAAPSGGLQITLASTDPRQVQLSTKANEPGTASITVMVHEGFRLSPEFYVHGLANRGSVTYTASAPGLTTVEATVKLLPSSIVIGGPFGLEKASFLATTGSGPSTITVHSVAIDFLGNYIPQPIAGGSTVKVKISSSDELVGTIVAPDLTLVSGSSRATTEFRPASPGNTRLAVSVPPGFAAPSQFGAVAAIVKLPGISVTERVAIGQNLQIAAYVSLGALAAGGGVQVTLASDDPKQLLLSAGPTEKGSSAITITIPEGRNNGEYHLHALGSSGMATYKATARGYLSRTGTISLTPSGVVVVGPLTLPEGQLIRSDAAGGARAHGFVTSLSPGAPTSLSVYTVQLDPTSHRSADISVQALRPGMSVTVDLRSTNSSVGTVGSPITIEPGSDHGVTKFIPLAAGSTVISLVTPQGFMESSNDTTLRAIVTQ